jgi:hypothetical protein
LLEQGGGSVVLVVVAGARVVVVVLVVALVLVVLLVLVVVVLVDVVVLVLVLVVVTHPGIRVRSHAPAPLHWSVVQGSPSSTQVAPAGSKRQVREQQSPSRALPSSHCSLPSTDRSPQPPANASPFA